MQSQANIPDLSEFETPDSLVKISGGKISLAQIRWALRFRNENGLNEAVVKMGKRLYIHRPTFMRWFAAGANRGAA